MSKLIHFALGLLFGTGLVVSGMSDPAKVLAFLDISAIPRGNWDPSLAFVMAGAIAMGFTGFRLAAQRDKPIISDSFSLPTRNAIDRTILIGPALFGIGWGMVGYCPGPALTALSTGAVGPIAFVSAMLVGMALARRVAPL